MQLKERIRMAVLDFLKVEPAREQQLTLCESVGFAASVARSRVWYRGDPSELSQLAKQLAAMGNVPDDTAAGRFWAQVPEIGAVRKAHTGLPAVMADTLSYMVKADCNELDFSADPAPETPARWRGLAAENDFAALIGTAVTETLVTGDGAFKISIDPAVSARPLVEFWPADRVEYENRRGRTAAVVFISRLYGENGRAYTLRERYAPGSVSYTLADDNGRPCELSTLPELAGLHNVTFDEKVLLALPLRFFASTRFPGRGRSIFESKTDAFDALDEVFSQWIDAIRAGRVLRYIPDDLVPRAPDTGAMTEPGYFTANYVVTGHSNKEDAQSKIEMQQAEIRYEAFAASYEAALELCLQGILSPATLSIRVSQTASAEAQRERKDITGYTRGAITDALERALPRVAVALLQAEDLMQGGPAGDYPLPVAGFGEYGAPDFDSRVKTVSAAAAAGVMSAEAQVEELWGASKDADWKAVEVERILAERGR